MAGTCADLAVELRASRARFAGSPALLEGLEIEIDLVRHRSASERCGPGVASVRLRPSRAA